MKYTKENYSKEHVIQYVKEHFGQSEYNILLSFDSELLLRYTSFYYSCKNNKRDSFKKPSVYLLNRIYNASLVDYKVIAERLNLTYFQVVHYYESGIKKIKKYLKENQHIESSLREYI